jgi:TPR repeat protein
MRDAEVAGFTQNQTTMKKPKLTWPVGDEFVSEADYITATAEEARKNNKGVEIKDAHVKELVRFAKEGESLEEEQPKVFKDLLEKIEQDYAKAALWWKKGADGGDPYSQYYLGKCYLKGEGAPKDLVAARDWFKKSADKGNDEAQFILGKMIIKGKGGPKDYVQGMGLIANSKYKGNSEAAAWWNKLENLIED